MFGTVLRRIHQGATAHPALSTMRWAKIFGRQFLILAEIQRRGPFNCRQLTRSTDTNNAPTTQELGTVRAMSPQPPERTTPPTVPTRLDRHKWHKTQHLTIPSISHGPKGFIRVKTKRQSIACSPRTLKERRWWRNFLQVRKPTEKRGFGLLSHEASLPDPLTAHPIVVHGHWVDCCVVDRTDFLQHVENSPLSCPKFGKKNMLGSKCGFRGRSCKVSFPPQTFTHQIHRYSP